MVYIAKEQFTVNTAGPSGHLIYPNPITYSLRSFCLRQEQGKKSKVFEISQILKSNIKISSSQFIANNIEVYAGESSCPLKICPNILHRNLETLTDKGVT